MMKCYIITLENNQISEKYSNECIQQARQFDILLQKYSAINGKDYLSHIHKLGIEPRYKFKKGRAGVFGCFLSHYYLWKQCAEENTPFLICEHDGYFIRSLPDNVMDTFTDVLKLDGEDPFSKNYNAILEQTKDNPIEIKRYYNDKAKFLEKNQTGNYMRGAYGYIIKPHAAKRIVDWIQENGFVPADQQIGDAIVDIQVTSPTVARLHPDYFTRIKELSLTGNPELL